MINFDCVTKEHNPNKIHQYIGFYTLIKFIYMLKIHMNQNAIFFSKSGYESFIEYSSDMYHIYENIEECNQNKEQKILIIFDNMIADMLSNKKLNLIVTCFFNTILFCCTKKY